MSLGVHNIGEATLHLLDHDDEQYVVTLPSAYGRSAFDDIPHPYPLWLTHVHAQVYTNSSMD